MLLKSTGKEYRYYNKREGILKARRIEVKGGRGRRHKLIEYDLKETIRYWKLKEKLLNRTLWRTHFGRG